MNLQGAAETECQAGDFETAPPVGDASVQPLPELSRRQQEILREACVGTPDKLIADKLGVSPRTLEGHWRAIHRKLGSANRCQAGFLFAILRAATQGKALA